MLQRPPGSIVKSTLGPEVPYACAFKAAQHQHMEVKRVKVIHEDILVSTHQDNAKIRPQAQEDSAI